MQISRLDKIIEDNVTWSTGKNTAEQTLFVLQDISVTLAMIYDKLCGLDSVSESTTPVETMAYVIPFEELDKHDSLFFQAIDYKEGYEVSFDTFETYETLDAKNNEVKLHKNAILVAFGEKMHLKEANYGSKWRCWNIKPNAQESEKNPWKK